ncbi:glutaredoxin family protein, partial [Paraburkholderia xenovorans]|uniref:glutaredoxin family protein n=1 Tax=Paraburkholderia xenovorans TaxID=36873 RepID=UPI0038B7AA41
MEISMSDQLRVLWQPGCTSCVKVKEFLTQLEVPFESVNIIENAAAREELARR